MDTAVKPLVLIDVVFPQTQIRGIARDALIVSVFSFFTALCAQVSFWIGPVPITGQTFAVLLSGILLGSKRGALSQVFYLLIGFSGLPFWFAPGGPLGIARLLGPTGGYLIGFVAAAFFVGKLAEMGQDRKIKTAIFTMILGNIIIYIFGLGWLINFFSFERALQVGLYPFLLGDLFKIFLAGLILPEAWKFIKRS